VTSSATALHAAEGSLPILWGVPPFTFTDAEGRSIDASALRGHVWIADLIFTRCVTMCPIITSRMSLLRRSVRSGEFRFVSFSIDPEYDTPAVLRAYAARWGADPRWLLLRPPPGKQTEFAQGMRAPFEHTEMPREPILHTTQFFLIDQLGRVRGLYSSLDDAAVRKLVADATLLDGSIATPPGGSMQAGGQPTAIAGASRGQALFQSLGCAACHADQRTGPPLAGLAGHPVRLEGGSSVLADAAYLRQSILAPAEKVVFGYDHLMPAYDGYLASTEVDDLVAYLQSIPAGAARPAAAARARSAR
jgi:protein SCO1/2